MNVPEKLEKLLKPYELSIIYVFGSMAQDVSSYLSGNTLELNPCGSDIDVAVLPKYGRRLSLRNQMELACDLEELFEVSRVDVVDLNQAPPALAAHAVMGCVLWTEDPVCESEFQLHVLRRYSDTLPLQKERAELITHHKGA
jgi:predicted nucleotidyltransferase